MRVHATAPRYLQLRSTSIQQLMASSASTTWSPNTPATINEALIVSAPKINTNFNTIGDGFSQEHNALGSTTDVGQHIQSTYIVQGTTPAADPVNARLFSALVATIPQLFLQYPTAVAANPIQLTTIAVPNNTSSGGASITEFSFLLNSQIIKIGAISNPNNGASFQVTFNTPFPSVISLFSCMPAGTANPGAYNVTGVTVNGFRLNTAGQGAYCYIAIGQ